MKIAIMGTGGVGGYFGGRLAHAGREVVFIARGDHLKAIQQNGLRVKARREILKLSQQTLQVTLKRSG